LNAEKFRQTKPCHYETGFNEVAKQTSVTVLFELRPTALIFGMWHSTGPKGGLDAKFERAMVSEIIGVTQQPAYDRAAESIR
jgi:hypothetical protein